MKGIMARANHVRELGVWTVSNFLSVLRVLLLPFIYHYLKTGVEQDNAIALSLMSVAVVSDILDGIIARRMGAESSMGKILDPLADKIFIGTMIVILVFFRGFPIWLVAIIIFRDTLVLLSALMLIRKRRIVLSSNWLGKGTTIMMAALILAYTMEWSFYYPFLVTLGLLFMSASMVSYGITMVHYFFCHDRINVGCDDAGSETVPPE